MTEEVKRSAGRPKGSKDKKNLKKFVPKPNPKSAKEDFKRDYQDLSLVAIYGIDRFTEELVDYLWADVSKEFMITDPVEQKAANLYRRIGTLPYSMYRFEQTHHVNFVECGHYPVIVVAEEYWEDVMKLPNPEDCELICLSHWEKN